MALTDGIRFVDDPGFECAGKRVLVRADFNVPMDHNGMITNDKRLRESIATIELLRRKSAKVILMSHLGRPKGNPEPKYSLKTVSLALSNLLKTDVHMATECVGDFVKSDTNKLGPGDVLLLENVRFHKRETDDYKAFGRDLAANGDIFVNDAFGSCHRAHGSVAGVAEVLPSYAGLLVKKELKAFSTLLDEPQVPVVAVLGGAKVSDKIGVIKALIDMCDALIIGGGMAYTFLKASGQQIGTSLLDKEHLGFAAEMLELAKRKGVKLLLPTDHLVGFDLKDGPGDIVKVIPDDHAAFDIGPETRKLYSDTLRNAKTIIFNGPMGVFETPAFAQGTRDVLSAMAQAKDAGATVVVGGGDSAKATEDMGFASKVTHVSTGGGASLELIEFGDLPGLKALRRQA